MYISIWKDHYLFNEKRGINKFPDLTCILNRNFDAEEVPSLVDGCICIKCKKESRFEMFDVSIKREIFKKIRSLGFCFEISNVYGDGKEIKINLSLTKVNNSSLIEKK